MEWLQYDYLRIKIQMLAHKMWRNKLITFLAFIFLIAAVIFILIHPYSVWYYFAAGFFASKMLDLIFEKTNLKYKIENTIDKLKIIKKGLI